MTETETYTGMVMTVNGPIPPESLGVTLPHEHIMSTFGADPAWKPEYPEQDVLAVVLPYLEKLKNLGCQTIFECTAAYFGRHPALLQRISKDSGIQIVTNTGYYAASGARYVPEHAYSESAAQIAERWSQEWQRGIDDTDIRPGFIKTAVGDGPLSGISRKLIEAAILTHKQTGLTIQTHLGDNTGAAQEILDLLAAENVHPSAWVWVHAHSAPAVEPLLQAASAGAWISLDSLNAERAGDILTRLAVFREQGLLNHVLLSHDGNTYNQGKFRPFEYLLTDFTRQCLAAGFTPLEVERLTVKNPAKAFAIGVKSRL